jgi:hypothetical protein
MPPVINRLIRISGDFLRSIHHSEPLKILIVNVAFSYSDRGSNCAMAGTADELYDDNSKFLNGLDACDEAFVAEIPSD